MRRVLLPLVKSSKLPLMTDMHSVVGGELNGDRVKEDLSRGVQVEGPSRGQCASSTGLRSLDIKMEGALAGTGRWKGSAATLHCWSGAGSLSLCPLSFSACPLMPWCLPEDFSRDVVCCHCHSQGLEAISDVYSGILCQGEPRGSRVLESKGVPCWQSLHVGLDREQLLISGLGS